MAETFTLYTNSLARMQSPIWQAQLWAGAPLYLEPGTEGGQKLAAAR